MGKHTGKVREFCQWEPCLSDSHRVHPHNSKTRSTLPTNWHSVNSMDSVEIEPRQKKFLNFCAIHRPQIRI